MVIKKIIFAGLLLFLIVNVFFVSGFKKVTAEETCGQGTTQNIVGCTTNNTEGVCEPVLDDPIQYTCYKHNGVCSGWVETDYCHGYYDKYGTWHCDYKFKDHYVYIPCGGSAGGGGGGGGGGGCITETTHECKKACTGGWKPSDQCGSCKNGKVCCKITTCVSPTPTPTPSCQGHNYIDAPVSGTTFVRGNSNNISGWARFCSGPAGAGVRERVDIHLCNAGTWNCQGVAGGIPSSNRPDTAGICGSPNPNLNGWGYSWGTSVPAGNYTLRVAAINDPAVSCVLWAETNITVVNPTPTPTPTPGPWIKLKDSSFVSKNSIYSARPTSAG